MLCSFIGGKPPKHIPWRCTHGTCVDCGVDKLLRVTDCKAYSDCAMEVHVLEWKLAPRAGTNAKGEQNTQIELTESMVPLNTVMQRFSNQLRLCRTHHNEMEWLRNARKVDIDTFKGNELLVVFTDFASTMDLRAAETDNCSQDAHAVMAIFVTLINRRDVHVN